MRRSFWNGLYEYAATRADFVDVYGDPSGRKTNSDTWTSFGVGSGFCHPDADKKNRHLWVRHDVDFSGDMTDAYQWMADGLLAMRSVYDLLV